MAKPQCLVFILRHKGLKSLKFGSVHRPKSWLCSFSTGLAQNNLAASWPSTFLLYQPGLDPGSISAKLDRSVPQTNQSVRQRVTVQNLHHESNPDWSHSFPLVLSLLSFFFHLMLLVTVSSTSSRRVSLLSASSRSAKCFHST